MVVPLILLVLLAAAAAGKSHERTTYITRVDSTISSTNSIIKSIKPSNSQVLYKYSSVFSGFSVTLDSQEEADALAKIPGVISVTPDDGFYQLHTTRTPWFLGLVNNSTTQPLLPKTNHLVVGFLDSGVWPEHESFNDCGLGPVPPTWKGSCVPGDNFTAFKCNQKLIGARYFFKGYAHYFGPPAEKSARDHLGHGTHTSTIAAGSIVRNASMFGLAAGEARGMAPDSRVATYKVCWGAKGRCFSSDILAGIDAAINDGVDVLSISLGQPRRHKEYNNYYYDDLLAVGAYSAMTKGIFVACSAGNYGPGTVTNVAPWITTVGASSLDREFPVNVSLGNGSNNYTGVSLYNEEPIMKSPAPLVYNGKCQTAQYDPKLVKGKVVVCDQDGALSSPWTSMEVKAAGGVGLIHINTKGEEIYPAPFFLPSAVMGKEAGNAIKSYMLSDPLNATAVISAATTKLGVQPAPRMASFSSRGPNSITPEILKPDLTAPGVTIIAAWTAATGPAIGHYHFDKRKVNFNILSGTSMSCPHVSGLALLLKGAHPDWSPAFIRSAMMTTAYTTYGIDRATESPATPLDYGSGHVDPIAALYPGLVYDATEDDYHDFLCALGYKSSEIKKVMTNRPDCSCDPTRHYSLGDFNYPSFSVLLPSSTSSSTTYTRTLTNVAEPSTYTVSVSLVSSFVNVTVEPCSLAFTQLNQKLSYSITFSTQQQPTFFGTIFGSLEWSDGKHKVRSPIVITQK